MSKIEPSSNLLNRTTNMNSAIISVSCKSQTKSVCLLKTLRSNSSLQPKVRQSPDITLNEVVDLRGNFRQIQDQETLQSCIANVSACLIDYSARQKNININSPSRLFMYYNERDLDDDPNVDSGSTMEDCVAALTIFSCCDEKDWAYDLSKVSIKPSDELYRKALLNYSISGDKISNDLKSLQAFLHFGKPWMCGMLVYPNTFTNMQNHTVNLSRSFDVVLGGHCIICVGYDNKRKVWIMRNSWGEDFGEDGYFYVPFSYPLIEPWRLKLLPVSVSENKRMVESATQQTDGVNIKPVSSDGVVDYIDVAAEMEKVRLMSKQLDSSKVINKMTLTAYSTLLYSLKGGGGVLNVMLILLIKLVSYLIYHAGVGTYVLAHYSGKGLSMVVKEAGKFDKVLSSEVGDVLRISSSRRPGRRFVARTSEFEASPDSDELDDKDSQQTYDKFTPPKIDYSDDSEITMDDCFKFYPPVVTTSELRLSASSTLGVTLSQEPNNITDEQSAVVMSLSHPDSNTRASIATIVLFYTDMNEDSRLSCRTLADATYQAFVEQKFNSANFVLIDLRVLYKNPNHLPNEYYQYMIRDFGRMPKTDNLPLVGFLVRDDKSIIDSRLFIALNYFRGSIQEKGINYMSDLKTYLGKDTQFPRITNPADFMESWNDFYSITSRESLSC